MIVLEDILERDLQNVPTNVLDDWCDNIREEACEAIHEEVREDALGEV